MIYLAGLEPIDYTNARWITVYPECNRYRYHRVMSHATMWQVWILMGQCWGLLAKQHEMQALENVSLDRGHMKDCQLVFVFQ